MGSVKATCHALIGSSRSKVLFLNLKILNLAPLWGDPSTINKCASLLYFDHRMSREINSTSLVLVITSRLARLLSLA